MSQLPNDDELVSASCDLAASLAGRAHELASALQRRRQQRLRRLLASTSGARLVFALADRALRPFDAATAAEQLREVARGPLDGLSPADAALLRLAARAAALAPSPVMALVGARLRYETRGLILPAEPGRLGRRLRALGSARRRPNLNLLGEAVLGTGEAGNRVSSVEDLLRRPDVDCVSVKVSAIAAGLSLVDFEGSLARVTAPLQDLYRLAASSRPHKLVNLDMEEHRDLDLTVEAFGRAVRAPELSGLTAGIALQAYLPETHHALSRVLDLASQRVSAGGAPLRVRIVKGANLAMEKVSAELSSWPQAPYLNKASTDASYKALLDRLVRSAAEGSVQVGVATHNLFDIAYALVLSEQLGASVEIEMLAGMADDQAAAVAERTGGVLLYTPVVARADYRNALAYLARRLDENTTPEGFLHQALDLTPGSPAWEAQAARFAAAVRWRHQVPTTPHHLQDRSRPRLGQAEVAPAQFVPEPPTDLTLPANRAWASEVLARPRPPAPAAVTSAEEVEAAVARATAAWPKWEGLGAPERADLLLAAAGAMADGREEAIATMATEAGKILEEGDAEVCEAIDYARWYGAGPGSLQHLLAEIDGEAESAPLGTVVVAPPWNFPYAIPAGGALAALAAGNAVILKPAPEAPATSALLARQLQNAGIPSGLVQYLPVADGEVGRRLVGHRGLGAVVLTGSHETAGSFARWAPERRLLAETSGKNAIVVSATADVDEAVRDIVASAFGHAGQKCSAASLAIVVASIYDKSPFLRQLADAVQSLRTGPANDPATQVGPIVGPFTPALRRALTELGPGERWLVQPRCLDGAPDAGRLWAPGVRTGVAPGSWAHMTEWFGPVLGVMRATDLAEAVRWQNAVPYGLTAGLSALDPKEHRYWADAVQAGNAYINRTTTAAVVGRQPFGGWKRSSHGPTAKAGGLNYLIGLRRWRDAAPEVSVQEATASYIRWWQHHFGVSSELAGLCSESNELRYRPFTPGVVVRAGAGTAPSQLEKALVLSELTTTPVSLSLSGRVREVKAGTKLHEALGSAPIESDEAFAARLAKGPEGGRLRLLGDVGNTIYQAAAAAGLSVLDEPICSCGRVELVRWLREQVVTRSLHRYGTIIY